MGTAAEQQRSDDLCRCTLPDEASDRRDKAEARGRRGAALVDSRGGCHNHCVGQRVGTALESDRREVAQAHGACNPQSVASTANGCARRAGQVSDDRSGDWSCRQCAVQCRQCRSRRLLHNAGVIAVPPPVGSDAAQWFGRSDVGEGVDSARFRYSLDFHNDVDTLGFLGQFSSAQNEPADPILVSDADACNDTAGCFLAIRIAHPCYTLAVNAFADRRHSSWA
mmetsp:Transcript_42227/g.90090  ORF Transcript_42227/g.90090 Transcript_42227/m.90090 type:complete len:224 (-) Transcript_42227:416-1087(-)